jgi:hypothetical protein
MESKMVVKPHIVILGCAAAALSAAVGFLYLRTRFGTPSTNEESRIVRQQKFIRRNLIIVAVAEILMTVPQAGIPVLFSSRIQSIMCAERQLPCAATSVTPSDDVIGDANLYNSYLSSAIGAGNFFGTLLIGSISDTVGRRRCILAVAIGLAVDSLACLLCSDLKVFCVQYHSC